MPRRPVSERTLVFLVGAVQFVNILDFMMVMPLGPDLARALGIPTPQLGLIGGSYTAAAAAAGLVGTLFLDRFDRRKALGVAMLGLVAATAAGGLATGLGTLMAARIAAGAFGGPATSVSLSIIADVIPAERRGRALGAVLVGFSVASVVGVPAGLELARRGGWQLPFFGVALLGLAVTCGAILLLPPLRGHLERAAQGPPSRFDLGRLLRRRATVLSLAMTVAVMMAAFMIVPNLATYLQHNLGYPRARLGLLYLAGGLVSFAAMRAIGRSVDRYGAFRIGAAGTAIFLPVLYLGFAVGRAVVPVMAIFVAFMLAMALRNVPYNTLITRVPLPAERAGFMSLQSCIQHLAAAAGSVLSARMLHEGPDGRLVGMAAVALVAMALAAVHPAFLKLVEAELEGERDTIKA